MLAEMTFTDARAKFTRVVDDALQYRPTVIKPRKTSERPSMVVSVDMMNELITESLTGPKFEVKFLSEADGSIIATLDPFELVVTGKTKEEAMENLIDDMITYAKDYMEDFPLYHNSKNRRNHFHLVFMVLACDTREQIKGLMGIA